MKLLAGLLFLVAPTLVAAPTPHAPVDKPIEFETMNEAAVRGLQYAARISEAYEFGGVILQKADGKFVVAEPDTDYSGDGVHIDEDPGDYDGKIVASYHTHPCLPESHMVDHFSPQDLSGARTANHPAYIADLCTGYVHLWSPGDPYEKKPEKAKGDLIDMLFGGPQLAVGKIVGQITVTRPHPLENTTPGRL